MRIPYPDNVTWDDRDCVQWPAGVAIILHSNAVEVDDKALREDVDAIKAAMAAYDPKAPTAADLARDRMGTNVGKDLTHDDIHARLLAIEKQLGLI